MANLKTLRLRIKSIRSTQKITKAMQMVAASKLRHAKSAMENAVAYYDLACKTLHDLLNNEHDEISDLTKLILASGEVKAGKILAVVVTSDRGLCGGFNQAVLRKAKHDIDALKADGSEVKIITIGKKGKDSILGRYGADSVVNSYATPQEKSLHEAAGEIYERILHELEHSGFNGLRIYFNHFHNAVSQIPQAKIVIPAATQTQSSKEAKAIADFESEGDNVLDQAVRMYIASELYHSIFESRASEEAARMMAMDNATKNAGEMIQKLTLSMNRSRQATITKELIEIISGAEAV